LTAVLYYR